MNLRALSLSEVTFSVAIEPDDSPVRGAFSSGDPDYAAAEREQEDLIIARLDRGELEAWCGVVVTAEWRGFKGHASLWGNSLDSDYTAETVVSEHDLRGEALADLNASIAALAGKLGLLEAEGSKVDHHSAHQRGSCAMLVANDRSYPMTEYVVINGVTYAVNTESEIKAATSELTAAGVNSVEVWRSPHDIEWIRENGDPDAVKTSHVLLADSAAVEAARDE